MINENTSLDPGFYTASVWSYANALNAPIRHSMVAIYTIVLRQSRAAVIHVYAKAVRHLNYCYF